MKARELINLGFQPGPVIGLLLTACQEAADAGLNKREIRERVRRLCDEPDAFTDDRFFSKAAAEILRPRVPTY